MIQIQQKLSSRTTLKLGGMPRFAFDFDPKSDNWKDLLAYANDCALGLKVLGGGANVLALDEEVDVTLIHLIKSQAVIEGTNLIVDAGFSINQSSQLAAKADLTGLEWALSIPGTWGGALSMNAGAYGSDTGACVEWVEFVDKHFCTHRVEAKDIIWTYRKSQWPIEPLCFTRLALALKKGDREKIQQRMLFIRQERVKKFPKSPNAGSVFKNPQGDSAGRLLELAGLKNFCVGKARVSNEHANIFTHDGAKGEDMLRLVLYARREVYKKFNVWLEPEWKLWDSLNFLEWDKKIYGM